MKGDKAEILLYSLLILALHPGRWALGHDLHVLWYTSTHGQRESDIFFPVIIRLNKTHLMFVTNNKHTDIF